MVDEQTVAVEVPQPSQKFGTFLGVFTPSVLTILGAIMYLRFGWVVGNVGLPLTLVIVTVASAITAITALSASAVATNMQVGVGGEYFMISRSLGLELGGAIGIPLFLCRTLSLTLYCFALTESLRRFLPAEYARDDVLQQCLTAAIIVVTTLIAGKSASASLKLQLPIMLAVGLSLAALTVGVFGQEVSQQPEWQPTYRTAGSFWVVFAVFFPAVTGFTAGIGMSGDLRKPKRSIPRGTMAAVATGWVVYMSVPVLLAFSMAGDELAPKGVGWTKVAVLGAWLVFPGMWGAILSSAFGSALGGPRVLQALASDGLAPKFLTRVSKTGQPTIATWATGAIALAAVALGDLNAVAQWVTIFFLTLYVTVNLSAAVESLVGDPSYRPTIRVPWWLSLAGSGGAIAVMFLINPYACAAATGGELALLIYLRRRAMRRRWGDVRAGLWVAVARFALLQLRGHRSDARNWRPHILLFADDLADRLGLARMASWFNQDRGVLTVCKAIGGDLKRDEIDSRAHLREMDEVLSAHGLTGFCEVNVVADFESGAVNIAQANGIAGLQSNTVMFGWPSRTERLESILRVMRGVSQLDKSTILARGIPPEGPRRRKRIDVWWRGKENNGDLMLLLAYLLAGNIEWRHAKIRVRSIVSDEAERQQLQASLDGLIPETRIQAISEVIVRPPDKSIASVMHDASSDADVVFLGLHVPEVGAEADYAARLGELVGGFGAAVLVRNASPFAGDLI